MNTWDYVTLLSDPTTMGTPGLKMNIVMFYILM